MSRTFQFWHYHLLASGWQELRNQTELISDNTLMAVELSCIEKDHLITYAQNSGSVVYRTTDQARLLRALKKYALPDSFAIHGATFNALFVCAVGESFREYRRKK